MMVDYSVQSCKQRWLTFYDPNQPGGRIVILRYSPTLPPKPLPNPELKRQRIEWSWQNYQAHLERRAWLDDDTVPHLDMTTGTELFAEAFGCTVHRPIDNMPFALPKVKNFQEAEKITVPSLDAPPLALVFEMGDELLQRAGTGAVFRLVDMQSPMDVAALIWEKSSFYQALVDTPEAVQSLSQKIKQLQFNFLDEWFRRYGEELIAHYPDYYLPKGVTLSVDEIGAISQKMFVQFFLPELSEFSERYGGLGMHSCANNRHQWVQIKKIPALRMLNINQPEDVLRDAYPFFENHTQQWHYGWEATPSPEEWVRQLPVRAHVVIDLIASSKDEACELLERVRAA